MNNLLLRVRGWLQNQLQIICHFLLVKISQKSVTFRPVVKARVQKYNQTLKIGGYQHSMFTQPLFPQWTPNVE
jgi:hypothetical protein